MQFTAHGVRRLVGQLTDLLVAQFRIRHEQQQKPVFVRQGIEHFLNQPAQLLQFQHAQRRINLRNGAVPNGIVRIGKDVPVVPGLLQVPAMIDGDAIEPASWSGARWGR